MLTQDNPHSWQILSKIFLFVILKKKVKKYPPTLKI